MESDSKAQIPHLAVATLLLILLVAAVYFLPQLQEAVQPQPPEEEQELSFEEFEDIIQNAEVISIVQDLRGAPENASRKAIQDCAVNLALSVGTLMAELGRELQVGVDLKTYSFDKGDVCYAYDSSIKTVQECEAEINGTYALIVKYGSASTTFYRTRTVITTNKYYGSACFITVQPPEVEPEPVEIEPNTTIDTSNLTVDEIYQLCTYRDYCASLGAGSAEQECLRAAGTDLSGDPRCCFGVHNHTVRDRCIESGAAVLHGVGEDYCQFINSDEIRDSCYYRYGTIYEHAEYCEFIQNATLKEECLAESEENS
ncbi:hypothetical protein DRN67_01520 [Candidatus Micrarchaeota archaeon]|nr:MAG: hypothetical protein DRN67_01520 [Candidatus Micrarchaeota archaeon]